MFACSSSRSSTASNSNIMLIRRAALRRLRGAATTPFDCTSRSLAIAWDDLDARLYQGEGLNVTITTDHDHTTTTTTTATKTTVGPGAAPRGSMPRFERFCEQYRQAEADGRDLEQVYNARDPGAVGQQLKVGGDYPDLSPHAPVHDATKFEWTAEVEAATGIFRSELARYIAAGAGEEVVYEDDDEGRGWNTDFFSGSYGSDFNGVALVRKGRPAAAAEFFPTTMAILNGLDLAGGNRLVFFGRQRAGSGIPPHSDCVNYLMTAHVGIHVPSTDESPASEQDDEAEGTVGPKHPPISKQRGPS